MKRENQPTIAKRTQKSGFRRTSRFFRRHQPNNRTDPVEIGHNASCTLQFHGACDACCGDGVDEHADEHGGVGVPTFLWRALES